MNNKIIFSYIIVLIVLCGCFNNSERELHEINKNDRQFLNSVIISCEVKFSYGHFTVYSPPLKHDKMKYRFSELLNNKKKIRFSHDKNGKIKEKYIPLKGAFKIVNIQHAMRKSEVSSVRLISDHEDKVIIDIELFHQKKECRIWIVYETEEELIQGLAALEGTFSTVM